MGYPLDSSPYFLNLIFGVMIVISHDVCCSCFSHMGDDFMYFMWMICIVPIGESPLNTIAVRINQSAITAPIFPLKGNKAHLAHSGMILKTNLSKAFEKISNLSFTGGLSSHLPTHKINIFKLYLMEQLRESSVENTKCFI